MEGGRRYIASRGSVCKFLHELNAILSSEEYELEILPKKAGESDSDPYTTIQTLLDLEYDVDDVRHDLIRLDVKDYIETLVDKKGEQYPHFWVFGRNIQERDVYIKVKIRNQKRNKVFCISFHFARYPLKKGPYYLE